MTVTPLHVLCGATGIVSGFIALYSSKGAWLHRQSGTVFVYAMLIMALSGAVMAIGRTDAAMNIPAGLVTAYLVLTAWLTVYPPSATVRQIERAAMIAAFALGAGSLVSAVVSGVRGHIGFVYPLVMFAVLAVGAGLGDGRMIRAGGLQGAARLKRHLWRMCTALFIAAGSFFLGPVRRIPEPLRIPVLRLIPLVAVVTMVYWLWRLRRNNPSRGGVGIVAPEATQ